ncbi:hypothetical protein [Streptosporangium sp. NPDC001681]|uniref:hypothetical protein n=1 Tax=Streptosporangium sp. NPDC001681 TaxID=3154395 RepID=UPI00332DD064
MNSRIFDQNAITDGAITERKAKEQAEALEDVMGLLADNGIRSMIVLTIKLDVNLRTTHQFRTYRPTELVVFYSGRHAATVTTTGGRSVSYVVKSPHREGEESAIKINDLNSPGTVAALLAEILRGITS